MAYAKVLTIIVILICQGIDAVESIIIQMNQITVDPRIIIRAFRNMPKLRLLALDGSIDMDLERSRTNNSVLLPRDFKCPNNLRYIQWNGCPFKSRPLNYWPQKLVQLSMRYSHVQKLWDSNTVQVCMIMFRFLFRKI